MFFFRWYHRLAVAGCAKIAVLMSADDPVSALKALNESDERQRSPMWGFAKPFLDIAKLLFGDQFSGADAVSTVVNWADQRSQQNLKELVDVIASEMKYLGERLRNLSAANAEHKLFVANEMPGLILDAIRRTENIRSKVRIARLARILVHAAELGPKSNADYAEEMLRIAVELGERDVIVFRQIVETQKAKINAHTGRVSQFEASLSWGWVSAGLQRRGFIESEVDSICAKLDSFGLVSRGERNVNITATSPTPYALLQKGLDFMEYIRPYAG